VRKKRFSGITCPQAGHPVQRTGIPEAPARRLAAFLHPPQEAKNR
jgi:hypothetical protein